jgi:iron(III) transport system ATP-binding protein
MPSPEPPALRVTGVTKAFGPRQVLDGIDVEVPRGAVTAVLGPSGGGKTTLLRIVVGFEHADAGTVAVDGEVVAPNVPPERRRIGIVPQEGALFPHLSVAANVGFGLPRGKASAERVAECLDLVGLDGLQTARPDQLSGGQQQRVALARALAPRPSLVVLDEPFSSLDASLRGQVRDEVFAAVRHARTTAVLVTHDQQEALSVADRIAVLLHGRIAQEASPQDVYRFPATLEVATFVGEAAVLDGASDGDLVRCALGTVHPHRPAPVGDVAVVVRPEQVLLGPAGHGVGAVVTHLTYLGHDALVGLRLAEGVECGARVHAADLPAPGSAVGVRLAGGVSVFPA